MLEPLKAVNIPTKHCVTASDTIARSFAEALPGLLIDFIAIFCNRKNLPAPRAGKNRSRSTGYEAKRTVTGTAFHRLISLPSTLLTWRMRTGLLYHRKVERIGGIAWDISWRNPEQWDSAIRLLSVCFRADTPELAAARQAAERIRTLIDAVDPFIQDQTREICPHCTSVCCIDRHGAFDLHDLVYAFCLCLPVPRYERHRQETDPCQFLAPSGCRLPRHERPFRCTWYFCETLITQGQNLPAKQVRKYQAMFSDLLSARIEMLHRIQKSLSGDPL